MGQIDWPLILAIAFISTQMLYLVAFLVEGYFYTRPVNTVDLPDEWQPVGPLPFIYLLYPVLKEPEATMRTTFEALARIDYPRDRFRVIAIPNWDDHDTIEALQRVSQDFPFLEIRSVPSTADSSWDVIWSDWQSNPKAYWWHGGNRKADRALPPKKTRQLIWIFYTLRQEHSHEDFLLNYIDADSAPQSDHFLAGAYGMTRYDVVQSTNVAGNLHDSLAAAFHSFDHMAWDGSKYRHMSADGRHPYWVLGKGLFFRGSDIAELGGFNPWITIEDPEVGMRMWKNGRRLGIIETPLIEEVPLTFGHGITQRKRWVAGFWQSLSAPLKAMDFTFGERLKARLNFVPCMSLAINFIGLPVGIWAGYHFIKGDGQLPEWTLYLAAFNLLCFVLVLGNLYVTIWKRTRLVLDSRLSRLAYLLKVNPVFLWVWWAIWLIPLWIGWRMYRRDHGLEWERTEKVDANADLVRQRLGQPSPKVAPVGTSAKTS